MISKFVLQMPNNPIAMNAGAPVGGNVPPSFHTQPPHPIQPHHQQAYAAAAVAAANGQYTTNQQTPYVFINQVHANVNVHHGPVPNGAQQVPNGSKDVGGNSAASSGSNPPMHMQHSTGIPTSLQNAHPTGIHPIHMQPGQMGHSTGITPQPLSQPPPLQTNVATSLAASGMTHPAGPTLMPQFMTNTFPVPHQIPPAQIPYNPIPSRSGSVQSQHSAGHQNQASMVSMQQLQQIYGYPPFFFQPNLTSQVPQYQGNPIHGLPQTQMPPMNQAPMVHMAQVQQSQMNVQQSPNQRHTIPQPIPQHPIILRNPLSPPAIPQGGNPINQAGIAISQAHQKPVSGTGFIPNQRAAVQSNPTSAPLGTVPYSSQQQMPQQSRQTQQQPSQLNPQAPYFPPQQATKDQMVAPLVATTIPNNGIVMQSPNSDTTANKHTTSISNQMKDSNEKEATTISGNALSDPYTTADFTNDSGDNIPNYESVIHPQQSPTSNDEVSTQDEDEGFAFGTVDLKSLEIHENVNFVDNNTNVTNNYLKDNPVNQVDQSNRKMVDSFENKERKEVTEAVSAEGDQEEQRSVKEDEKNDDMENNKAVLSDDMSEPPQAKSWASLFKSKNSGAGPINVPSSNDSVYLSEGKLTARIQPYKENLNESHTSGASAANANEEAFNGKDVEMGNFLKEYSLNFRAPSIKPRGLSNRSNWCFVNAILQALVACPPFYNLMKSLPKDLLESSAEQTNQSVKILRAVYHFFTEFSPLDNFPKLNKNRNKKNEDLPLGKMLEPTTIYNYLLELDSDTFKVIEGRQEDAEEFLSFLLNGLNDEMIALLKMVDQQERERSNER